MSEFMFGFSRSKPTRAQAKKMQRAAENHDAWLIQGTFPGVGYQRWFAARNYGSPFDQATAKAVMAEVEAILNG